MDIWKRCQGQFGSAWVPSQLGSSCGSSSASDHGSLWHPVASGLLGRNHAGLGQESDWQADEVQCSAKDNDRRGSVHPTLYPLWRWWRGSNFSQNCRGNGSILEELRWFGREVREWSDISRKWSELVSPTAWSPGMTPSCLTWALPWADRGQSLLPAVNCELRQDSGVPWDPLSL